MQFISCAPNCVDVLLWRAFKDIRNGAYIDFTPTHDAQISVTQTFYNLGWRGLNICTDQCQRELSNLRHPQDSNICVEGSERFATVWRDHAASKSLIHFAHIASDYVRDVFNNDHWQAARPWILVIQLGTPERQAQAQSDVRYDSHNRHDWGSGLLISNGYQFAYTDGLYWLCVAEEHSDLLDRLKHPPNVFDDFTLGVDPEQLKSHVVLKNSFGSIDGYLEALIAEKKNAARARATVYQLRRSLSHSSAELQALLASKSWKITAPLRRLVTTVSIELPRALRYRVEVLVKRVALRLSKYPKVAQAARRLVDRMPGLQQRLSRWTGAAAVEGVIDNSTVSRMLQAGEFDAMPVRAQQIYADLYAAILNKNKA